MAVPGRMPECPLALASCLQSAVDEMWKQAQAGSDARLGAAVWAPDLWGGTCRFFADTAEPGNPVKAATEPLDQVSDSGFDVGDS